VEPTHATAAIRHTLSTREKMLYKFQCLPLKKSLTSSVTHLNFHFCPNLSTLYIEICVGQREAHRIEGIRSINLEIKAQQQQEPNPIDNLINTPAMYTFLMR
jgi:hypothetical protein